MNRILFVSFILCLFVFKVAAKRAPSVVLLSPDKSIKVEFTLNAGVPHYQVYKDARPVIQSSKMGFVLKELPLLGQHLAIVKSERTSLNETWEQPWGEAREIQNNYNSVVITLQEQTGLARLLVIEFRAFNDGIGFRYEIPEQPNLKEFVIMDERTEFVFAQDLAAWWIPAYHNDIDSECIFKKSKISELTTTVHTPLTAEADNLYVSIHEAALMDYAAMTLLPQDNKTLKCDLVPWINGDRVIAKAPLKTPWRTIQIGKTPGDLVTSYLILNLNEPNALGSVEWVKPGKYMGIWWSMHTKLHTWEKGPHHGATTENMKRWIDFASKHNISSILAEGWNEGWEGDWTISGNFNFTKPYSDFDIDEITAYGRAHHVGIIGHHETGGNVANYENQLEGAFQYLQKHGISRVKTGYVNRLPGGERHQGQFMIRHYQKVLETAAKYHVMLNVHEPVKDTGLRRTYPNMMTREGARGTEYEAWSTGNPPSHTTILPFTRCLAGPLDYTPGIFNLKFDESGTYRVHTTLAKQLALYVVIYSPLQMAADLPEHYENHPAFKFIEDVPTDWETTRVLDSKIGAYTTVVRKERKGDGWYLGSITNEEQRNLTVALSFLEPNKAYTAEIYSDGVDADYNTNPFPVVITKKVVQANDNLTLSLAPGGGTAIRFYPNH
jgi:alpha-glucosidase